MLRRRCRSWLCSVAAAARFTHYNGFMRSVHVFIYTAEAVSSARAGSAGNFRHKQYVQTRVQLRIGSHQLEEGPM